MTSGNLGPSPKIGYKHGVVNNLGGIWMETKKTLIRGLAIDVLVVETMHSDSIGTLFYRAEIHVRGKKTGAEKLVKRTRIPGTANELAKAVQQHGLRALEVFSTLS
jgi:hypothetical protein